MLLKAVEMVDISLSELLSEDQTDCTPASSTTQSPVQEGPCNHCSSAPTHKCFLPASDLLNHLFELHGSCDHHALCKVQGAHLTSRCAFWFILLPGLLEVSSWLGFQLQAGSFSLTWNTGADEGKGLLPSHWPLAAAEGEAGATLSGKLWWSDPD